MGALDPGVPVLAEAALADRVTRKRPVMVLFYADWCPFCAKFLPVFRSRAEALPVDAVAANISHPDDPRWEQFEVETVPTLVVFSDGQEHARLEARAGVGLDAGDLATFVEDLAPLS